MPEDFVKKAIEDAVTSLLELMKQESELERQRVEVEREEDKLMLKIISLAALSDDFPENSSIGRIVRMAQRMGLTNGVRLVLRLSGEWMTPVQIRDRLIRLGMNLERFKNSLASIHTVLGRLSSGEDAQVKIESNSEGKAMYRWQVKKKTNLAELLEPVAPEEARELLSSTAKTLVNEPQKRSRKGKKKE
jgi:hypothetical protein